MQGLLVLNKPKGITSFAAVAKLRRLLNVKRIGHTGTLDPLASGVLICLIGRPCVLSDYIMSGQKTYVAKLKFGVKTDSFDSMGTIIDSSKKQVTKEEFIAVCNSFIGNIKQLPPMFSAKKVDGKRLYTLAREGKEVERKPNDIYIKEIKVLNFNSNEAEILVTCSKGTYIRSLINDIGEKLGSFAIMSELTRIENGGFSINDAVLLDDLTPENIKQHIISAEKAVSNYPKISVTQKQAVRFYNGGELDLSRIKNLNAKTGDILRVGYLDVFLGLGKVGETALKVLCPIENPNKVEE